MITDLPCITYLAFYVISIHITETNSRSSTHWKLDPKLGKVVQADDASKEDVVFNILLNKITSNGQWILKETSNTLKNVQALNRFTSVSQSNSISRVSFYCNTQMNNSVEESINLPSDQEQDTNVMLTEKKEKNIIKEEIKEKANVFSEIGKLLPSASDIHTSVECFHQASSSPSSDSNFFSLARLFFNLYYLDDVVLFSKCSLELSSLDQTNHWLQHYTLGEIFKTYGHYHDAIGHFQIALNLNPSHSLTEAHLRELEMSSDGRIRVYTLFIIAFLVFGVLFGILSTVDLTFDNSRTTSKTSRYFNRALAMRSIKMGVNPRTIRMKKYIVK